MRHGEEGVQDLLHKTGGTDCPSLPMEVARAEQGKLGILMVKPCQLDLEVVRRAEEVNQALQSTSCKQQSCELKQQEATWAPGVV